MSSLEPGTGDQPPRPDASEGSAIEMLGGVLGGGGLLLAGLGVLTWLLANANNDFGEYAPPMIGIGVVAAVVGVVIVAVVGATPAGRERWAAEEAAEEAQREAWHGQLERWGYDRPAGGRTGAWPPAGFRTHEAMAGSMMAGEQVPLWAKCHLQLAPPGRPELAARMAPFEAGPAVDVPLDDVVRLQARSRSGAWFGLGAAGSMAAHAASTLDYHLAGYELTLVTRSGMNLRLRMLGGTPPLSELQQIEARAAGSPF